MAAISMGFEEFEAIQVPSLVSLNLGLNSGIVTNNRTVVVKHPAKSTTSIRNRYLKADIYDLRPCLLCD